MSGTGFNIYHRICPLKPPLKKDIQGWHNFIKICKTHHLRPLLYWYLGKIPKNQLSSEMKQEIKAGEFFRLHFLKKISSAKILSKTLTKNGIDHCFLKGMFLSYYLYRDSLVRQSTDIDILVRPTSVKTVIEKFNEIGYQHQFQLSSKELFLFTRLRTELTLIHKTSGIKVDLHWSLGMSQIPEFHHNLDKTFSFEENTTILKTEFGEFRFLDINFLYPFLLLNGASETWSRYDIITDINRLYQLHSDLNFRQLAKTFNLESFHNLLTNPESLHRKKRQQMQLIDKRKSRKGIRRNNLRLFWLTHRGLISYGQFLFSDILLPIEAEVKNSKGLLSRAILNRVRRRFDQLVLLVRIRFKLP